MHVWAPEIDPAQPLECTRAEREALQQLSSGRFAVSKVDGTGGGHPAPLASKRGETSAVWAELDSVRAVGIDTMKRHHQRTLEALFAHPLQHAIRVSKVEALLRVLGAEVEERADHRLHIRMPSGQETWLHSGAGPHHPDLDGEAVLRLRQFLRDAGVTPERPVADGPSPRGDQSRRLVLLLNHRHTDVYRFEGEEVEHALLQPHGIWGSEQNLTHRHDRDQAGQKAPLDNEYLARITAAMADADAVLLLGHGQGSSDLRQVLLHYLETHRRDLLAHISGIETVDDSALSEAGLLAVARAHFGNLPHRHPVASPGQEQTLG